MIDRRSQLACLPRALRLHHWVKNLLVFVPLVMAHQLDDPAGVASASVAFVMFGLAASAGYLLNDLADLEADAENPHKKHRPLAAGELSARVALVTVPILLAAAAAIGLALLPWVVTVMVLGYFAASVLYTYVIKKLLVLDVLCLAGFYAYRVLVGGVAVEVPISPWLIAFSIFFFLSLALVKRSADLRDLAGERHRRYERRAYTADDLDLFRSLGVSAGYLSVLVLALYIRSDSVTALYANARLLWLICPCLLYWITRIWLITQRAEMHQDPILFAIRDGPSYVVAAVIAGVVFAATL